MAAEATYKVMIKEADCNVYHVFSIEASYADAKAEVDWQKKQGHDAIIAMD